MLLVPIDGECDSLSFLVAKAMPEDLVLRLFTGNITPAETDQASDYTEAGWTGYGPITLTGADWIVTPGSPSVAAYAKQTFTSTADGQSASNFGYFLTRASSGRIAWAERFPAAPYLIANAGDTIAITPRITQASAT